jgi:hypothetical protein
MGQSGPLQKIYVEPRKMHPQLMNMGLQEGMVINGI